MRREWLVLPTLFIVYLLIYLLVKLLSLLPHPRSPSLALIGFIYLCQLYGLIKVIHEKTSRFSEEMDRGVN